MVCFIAAADPCAGAGIAVTEPLGNGKHGPGTVGSGLYPGRGTRPIGSRDSRGDLAAGVPRVTSRSLRCLGPMGLDSSTCRDESEICRSYVGHTGKVRSRRSSLETEPGFSRQVWMERFSFGTSRAGARKIAAGLWRTRYCAVSVSPNRGPGGDALDALTLSPASISSRGEIVGELKPVNIGLSLLVSRVKSRRCAYLSRWKMTAVSARGT